MFPAAYRMSSTAILSGAKDVHEIELGRHWYFLCLFACLPVYLYMHFVSHSVARPISAKVKEGAYNDTYKKLFILVILSRVPNPQM